MMNNSNRMFLGQDSERLKILVGVSSLALLLVACDGSQKSANDDLSNLVQAAAIVGETSVFEVLPGGAIETASTEFSSCEPVMIDISGSRLHGKIGYATSTPLINLASPLPIGEYPIKLYYEDLFHDDADQPDQLHEIWFAEFFDESGNLVVSTPDTIDLPVNQIKGSTDVGVHYFDRAVYSVRGVHAYESNDFNSIHPTSIEVGCSVAPIEDTVPPVITLLGNNSLVVSLFSGYIDPGATAVDNVDGDISSEIVVAGDTVNLNVPGIYFVTYDVSDSAGNPAVQVARDVEVVLDVAFVPPEAM